MIFKRKAQIDLNKSTLNLNIAPIAKNPIQIPLPSLPDSISIPHETFENSSEMHTKEHVLSAKIQEKEKSNMKLKRKMKVKRKDSEYEEEQALSIASEQRLREGKRKFKSRKLDEVIGISGEEEKLLMIAMKNSLREKQIHSSIPLNEIEEMKVYTPTEEEFMNPVKYVEKLYKEEAYEYGCVKIIPPKSYKPPKVIDKESEKKLPTRYQTLQELSQGKPFSVNSDGLTCQELIERDLGRTMFKDLTKKK